MNLTVTDAQLETWAGAAALKRGRDYWRQGRVKLMGGSEASYFAEVRGTEKYTVQLTLSPLPMKAACNCPVGAGSMFCKHAVAAVLQLRDGAPPPGAAPAARKRKGLSLADAVPLLQNASQDELVGALLEWAQEDAGLERRLLQFAARQAGGAAALETAEAAFNEAIAIRRFLTYREARGWARRVHDAVSHFEKLLDSSQAAGLIEVVERALARLERVMNKLDDSDGHVTDLRNSLQRIHREACRRARPDPVALAKRLFTIARKTGLEVFWNAPEEYREILGEAGLAEYGRLAAPEWAQTPVLTEQSSTLDDSFRIRHVMESLARASGDLEQLVAVLSRDLSSAWRYLRVAEACAQAGAPDQALHWAELGLEAFPENTDRRLRLFVAEQYHRLGRTGDALRMVWANYEDRPTASNYVSLKEHAQRVDAAAEWRERAIAHLRGLIERWKADHSSLVELFLEEGDVDAAWREAQQGGCAFRLWEQLAEARRAQYPAEAGTVFLRLAADSLTRIQNGRYEETVAWLEKARPAPGFAAELARLRATYKAKRNFILLAAERFPE